MERAWVRATDLVAGSSGDRMKAGIGVLGVLVGLGLAGCAVPGVTDYRAGPAEARQDWGDRLHLERSGVRVLVGPASVFPYERLREDGVRERGQYQLFTRVIVENVGEEAVVVLWEDVRLESADGERYPLVESGYASARVRGLEGAVPVRADSVAPGARVVRALIPESLFEIGVGEPMVELCDGCEFRLVVPVRVGEREQTFELTFRLTARQPEPCGSRLPWRDGEG